MLRYARFGVAIPSLVVAAAYGAGSVRCLASRIRSQACGTGDFGSLLLFALPVIVVSILLRVVDDEAREGIARSDRLRKFADLGIACSATAVLAQWLLCR